MARQSVSKQRTYIRTNDLVDHDKVPTIPVNMSEMSPVVKSTLDAINANVNSAAFQPITAFATAAQGVKADTAIQSLSSVVPTTRTVNAKALSSNIVLTTADIADSTDKRYVTDAQLATFADIDVYYRDTVTTNTAIATVVRSIDIPFNSAVFIDTIVKFQDTATRLTGGYIWATLSFGRGPSGNPVAYGSLDILESHNLAGSTVTMPINSGTGKVDITVKGKAGVNTAWALKTKVL